jgi:tetrapyrrole methylase family protein/MazG family protein
MEEFKKLVKIVKKLRSPKGCKWDRAQKIGNLKSYLLEEVYEFLDTIDSKKIDKIKEELGDIFLLLVFIACIFEEKRRFSVNDVLKGINEKLIARHPHVFSKRKVKNKEEIVKYWIKKKAKDKNRKSIFDRLPKNAPSLLLAYLFFKESSYLGVKQKKEDLIYQLKKSIKKDSIKNNLIEIFFLLSQLASHYNLDVELLLRKKILKEAKRIKYL